MKKKVLKRKVTCTVSRNGDLIHRTYLQVTLPALTNAGKTVRWVDRVGEVLIDYVNVEIGGQEIDRHYGEWLTIWSELTQTAEHEDGYNVLIGNTTSLTTAATSIPSATLYIPLQFWLKSTLTKKRELNSFSRLIIFILICNTYKLLETPKVLDTRNKMKILFYSKNSKNKFTMSKCNGQSAANLLM